MLVMLSSQFIHTFVFENMIAVNLCFIVINQVGQVFVLLLKMYLGPHQSQYQHYKAKDFFFLYQIQREVQMGGEIGRQTCRPASLTTCEACSLQVGGTRSLNPNPCALMCAKPGALPPVPYAQDF